MGHIPLAAWLVLLLTDTVSEQLATDSITETRRPRSHVGAYCLSRVRSHLLRSHCGKCNRGDSVTRNTDGDRMLAKLRTELEAGKAVIEWDPSPAGFGHGTISFHGVEIRVSDLYYLGRTTVLSLVKPGGEPTYRPFTDRPVQLRASNPLENWRINRVVRASFKAFQKELKQRQADADQKVISQAFGKVMGGGHGEKDTKGKGAGQELG